MNKAAFSPIVMVGADPELWVVDKENTVVSAIPYFPEYKGGGEPVAGGLGFVIHDNVAAEFSMKPAENEDEWVATLEEIKAALRIELERRAEGKELRLVTNFASAKVAKSQLKHVHAKTFGCDPDMNAWNNGLPNMPPDADEVGQMRVIGGHIHIGMKTDERVNCILTSHWGRVAAVRLLDATVGQYVLSLEAASPHAESFVERRRMYGKAGSFRVKDYGLEYRTPSAIWLESPETEENVYRAVNKAMHLIADLDTVNAIAVHGGNSNALGMLVSRAGVHASDVERSINTGKPIQSLVDGAIS